MNTNKSAPIPGARLIDTILAQRSIKNDAHLARAVELAPPVISKIRNGKLGVSGEVMIRFHEAFDMPIAHIKKILGQPVFVRPELRGEK